MILMRAFSKVDEKGRILIPTNIQRQMGLKRGQLIEIKVNGAATAQYITVHKREAAR